MNLDQVWADESVKKFLKESIIEKRISHAQIFVGKPGYGTLTAALAYAREILCEGEENCQRMVDHLNHQDLHFSIPTFKVDKIEAITKNYIRPYKELIQENPYVNLNDWYDLLDAGNKQGFLSKNEIDEVVQSLSLKSVLGGYKILIIWYADKMKSEFANKFLKLLEEPPDKTLFLLLTESTENMLDTITSRCIEVNFKPLSHAQVSEYLQTQYKLPPDQIQKVADVSNGDIREAQNWVLKHTHKENFEKEFIEWTRNSYQIKTKLHLLQNIMEQAERISTWGTEQQKLYLQFCMETFRQALLTNYNTPNLVHTTVQSSGFNFEGFSQFVSGANIQEILEELNNTYFYLERNANKKLAFTNLGIKLTRLIHKKQ